MNEDFIYAIPKCNEEMENGNDIHTYKEIVAFSEGKHLDEIQKQREIGKRPYQTVLKVLAGAIIGALITAIASLCFQILSGLIT